MPESSRPSVDDRKASARIPPGRSMLSESECRITQVRPPDLPLAIVVAEDRDQGRLRQVGRQSGACQGMIVVHDHASSPFRGRTRMKRLTLALFALGLVTVAVTCLVAGRPATTTGAERTPALALRAAVAFDTSPPLGSMEQFIPDKPVVIHPAEIGRASWRERV